MTKLLLPLAAVILVLALAMPAVAQCDNPTCAQEIITRATANAQSAQWQAAQQATRAAYSANVQATAAAGAVIAGIEATRQAQLAEAEATRQAQQVETEATRQAHSANLQATATRQVQAQAIQATLDAQRAEATRAAYSVALGESQERARVGLTLLYAAAVICLLGVAYTTLIWARTLASKATRPAAVAPAGDVVDAIPVVVPLLPPGPDKPPPARVVNNPRAAEAIAEWFYSEEGSNE